MLITCAHNFEDEELNLKDAVFTVNRDGMKNWTATLKIITKSIRLHHRFDKNKAEEEGVY